MAKVRTEARMQMLHEIKFINLLIKIHGGGGFKIILNLRPPRPLSRLLIRTQQERGSGGGMSARERYYATVACSSTRFLSSLTTTTKTAADGRRGSSPGRGAHPKIC